MALRQTNAAIRIDLIVPAPTLTVAHKLLIHRRWIKVPYTVVFTKPTRPGHIQGAIELVRLNGSYNKVGGCYDRKGGCQDDTTPGPSGINSIMMCTLNLLGPAGAQFFARHFLVVRDCGRGESILE